MKKIIIKPANLYILSGCSGSGKSYFLNSLVKNYNLDMSCVINPDTIRRQLSGVCKKYDENGSYEHLNGWDNANKEAFEIAYKILETRAKHGLLTFFDSTNLDERSRNALVKIASAHSMNSEVIIFNVSEQYAQSNLLKRKERFSPQVVSSQLQRLALTSTHPTQHYNPLEDKVYLIPNLVEFKKFDVLGDTHGLMPQALSLLKKLGWSLNSTTNTLEHQDSERGLVVLGDVIDRGEYSWEWFEIIKNTTQAKKAHYIIGNHENKVLRVIKKYFAGETLETITPASALTFKKFLTLSEHKQKDYYKFMSNLPWSLSAMVDKNTSQIITTKDILSKEPGQQRDDIFNIAFTHADVSGFDEHFQPRSQAIYGTDLRLAEGAITANEQYDKLFELGANKHLLIHGHYPCEKLFGGVISLDNRCAQGGQMMALNAQKFIENLKNNNFSSTPDLHASATISEVSGFDFKEYIKNMDLTQVCDLSKIKKVDLNVKNKR